MINIDTDVRHTTKADGFGVNKAAGTTEDPFEAASDIGINKMQQQADSDYDSESTVKFAFQYYNFVRPQQIDPNRKECIDICVKTAESAQLLISYCLKMGAEHAAVRHVGLLSLCADTCMLAAKTLSFESEFVVSVLELTAEMCERTAASSREINETDEQMQEFADLCQTCAEHCSSMIKY